MLEIPRKFTSFNWLFPNLPQFLVKYKKMSTTFNAENYQIVHQRLAKYSKNQ